MNQGTPDITLKLETVNSLLHALGILFGIVCMPILLINASKLHNVTTLTGASIYAACFLMVFISSTLYHGFQRPDLKRVLKIVDHISIYFLIAGTYTPIILTFVNNTFGITLLVILWGLTFFGIFFKIFYTGKFEIISTLLYVLMGWILFVDNHAFFASMPSKIIMLVAEGGVLYSIGVIFYLWHKFTYHHVIWHLFVLAAAICHYSAVLLAV
ncbi:MAG: hemolysin III family protein [Ferruginibacter sp.]|nr:hemolysin III family protein [Ferruginibacter sp.]